MASVGELAGRCPRLPDLDSHPRFEAIRVNPGKPTTISSCIWTVAIEGTHHLEPGHSAFRQEFEIPLSLSPDWQAALFSMYYMHSFQNVVLKSNEIKVNLSPNKNTFRTYFFSCFQLSNEFLYAK